MTDEQRNSFDRLLESEIEALPPRYAALLAEVPLIVDDEPAPALLCSLGLEPGLSDLCGLHDGLPQTERSVEDPPAIPEQMMLFRGPICRLAEAEAGPTRPERTRSLRRQIHITLLHEIGHHFGLDEDDLEALGYA